MVHNEESRVALVTGGTEGIGRAVAIELARGGDRVIIVGRSASNGEAALAELERAGEGRGHRFIRGDLSSLRDTARVAHEVLRATKRLDAVVCSAGILSTIPEWTPEGLERTFALNFLSRHALIEALLPRLVASASGRVVLVANAGMYRDTIDLDDLHYRRGKRGLDVSARSQFANDLLATGLAARLEGTSVEVTCVHPGMVRTRVFANARGLPWFFRVLLPILRLFQITPALAARTPAFLAQSKDAIGSNGRFYGPRCAERGVPAEAQRPERYAALLAASQAIHRPYLAEAIAT